MTIPRHSNLKCLTYWHKNIACQNIKNNLIQTECSVESIFTNHKRTGKSRNKDTLENVLIDTDILKCKYKPRGANTDTTQQTLRMLQKQKLSLRTVITQ